MIKIPQRRSGWLVNAARAEGAVPGATVPGAGRAIAIRTIASARLVTISSAEAQPRKDMGRAGADCDCSCWQAIRFAVPVNATHRPMPNTFYPERRVARMRSITYKDFAMSPMPAKLRSAMAGG